MRMEGETEFRRFLVIGVDGDGHRKGGCWGGGDTLADAEKRYCEAGGDMARVVTRLRCVSPFPFARWNEQATYSQSDAFVNSCGDIVTIRCQREDLDSTPPDERVKANESLLQQ